MKFESTKVSTRKNILANDHYAAISYDCSKVATDESKIIKAGTVVPANDATAMGILLNDVDLNRDPNGAVLIHGFVAKSRLKEEISSEAKLSQITVLDI